jgi:hypothetical protein
MKKLILFSASLLGAYFLHAQCTTTNATTCACLDTSQTGCDLLPDIEASAYAFQTYMGGPNEYPQQNAGTSVNGQGPDDGRLRVSASTPNVGRGPLEVRGVDMNGMRWFLCGNDTFSLNDPTGILPFTCPNGDPNPHQLLKQRIYHKNGNSMTYTERFAGSMTYHPTHGHYHVDDWERMTLRIDNGDPNPLNWPIVGTGIKVGFCVEDYQTCSTANGHCTDSLGNTLTNNQITNFNLGGGNYGCGSIYQGITVGYTDIYWETLDGQWIDIPPGTCNGLYYVVIEVDPQNFWMESTKTNNWFASPVTLTQQSPSGSPVIEIWSDNPNTSICQGDSVTLTCTAGSQINWSTGATTQSIRVPSTSATYSVTVTNYCGTDSASFSIYEVPTPTAPTTSGDSICAGESATLNATGSGTIIWFDSLGTQVGMGNTFVTPPLGGTTMYWAASSLPHQDTAYTVPHNNALGAGDWKQSDQYETFDAIVPCDILSVKVYAQVAGNRDFYLKDNAGTTLQSITVNVPDGQSRVTLNFTNIPIGTGYRLGVAATTGNLFMYRNNSSRVSYPYGVDGIVKMIGSSGGASYYYYCYDWQVVSSQANCFSPMIATTASVDPCLGLNENYNFESSISVFPNPSEGNFSVAFNADHSGDVIFSVTDLVGNVVYTKVNSNFTGHYNGTLDLSSLAKGVYILNISYQGKPYQRKLIIQ